MSICFHNGLVSLTVANWNYELLVAIFFSIFILSITYGRNQPYIRTTAKEGIGHLRITIIGTQVVKDLL